MRSILRNLVLASAAMATAALATTTAMAEQATLRVPFSFTVAGKNCPAGNYSVQWERSHNRVILTSREASEIFTWVVGPGDPAPTDTAVVLKFVELGETHALRSVQYGSMITSRLDKKTKQTEHAPVRIVQGQ